MAQVSLTKTLRVCKGRLCHFGYKLINFPEMLRADIYTVWDTGLVLAQKAQHWGQSIQLYYTLCCPLIPCFCSSAPAFKSVFVVVCLAFHFTKKICWHPLKSSNKSTFFLFLIMFGFTLTGKLLVHLQQGEGAVFYLIAIIFTSPVSCVRWCTHSKTEQRKNTSAIMKDSNWAWMNQNGNKWSEYHFFFGTVVKVWVRKIPKKDHSSWKSGTSQCIPLMGTLQLVVSASHTFSVKFSPAQREAYFPQILKYSFKIHPPSIARLKTRSVSRNLTSSDISWSK